MDILFADDRPTGDYALVLPATAKDRSALDSLGKAGSGISSALDRQRFEGDSGSAEEHFADDDGTARRVIVVGVGDRKAGDWGEKLGGNAVAKLLTSGETRAVIDVTTLGIDAESSARVGFGAALRSWRLDSYRTRMKDKNKPTLKEVIIVGGGGVDAQQHYDRRYAPVYSGVALTRELVTEPANVIHPGSFVDRVSKALDGSGVKISVLDAKEMRKLGMGALLGVAQGSVHEGKMLILEWNGGGSEKPVAFVGKGVTFDTGGISIKPALNMEMMKWDMGGAAAVCGAMLGLAGRKAKANVVGICGLVENMPSGTAQRPGDVVTSMSGQTIEVINTDAEGRLVLADAITYVQRTFKPTAIIDFATLTGAILVALGHEFAGLFSNDDSLAKSIYRAGERSGDKVWRMPLAESFDRLIESQIADMKNVGPREGGSITAAQFIKRFVEGNTPWAHIDMAGTAWSDKASATHAKGATGFGVRLLDDYVAEVLEK